MPWTKADVDRHKKGLTDAQKDRWVAVANDARKRCLEKGGTEKDCDASAIRQANSVVGAHSLEIHNNAVYEYTPRTEYYDDREYLVVPVVMMVEGVHHGSFGPILHRADQLGEYIDIWNNRPVTVEHPRKDDVFVSANSPEMLAQYEVGRIFNTRFEDEKLKAEAWIDVQKAIAVSPIALTALREGKPIEVSVGVFSDTIVVEGEWHGEVYEAIAENYRPDHLALLPEGQGACSWADGCGIRTNSVETASNKKQNKSSNILNQGGKMSDDKNTPCCEGKVDDLIANKATRFTAEDKEWLMTLEESQIDKLSPMEPEKKMERTNPPPQVNKDQVIDEFKSSLKSIEDYTKLMPEEMKVMVNDGVALRKEKREKLIKGIMDNTKDVWEEDALKAMSIDTLEGIVKSIGKPVDYSGMGQPPVVHGADGEEAPLDSSPDFNTSGKEDK